MFVKALDRFKCGELTRKSMFLTSKWKWKWLKILRGLPSSPPPVLGPKNTTQDCITHEVPKGWEIWHIPPKCQHGNNEVKDVIQDGPTVLVQWGHGPCCYIEGRHFHFRLLIKNIDFRQRPAWCSCQLITLKVLYNDNESLKLNETAGSHVQHSPSHIPTLNSTSQSPH